MLPSRLHMPASWAISPAAISRILVAGSILVTGILFAFCAVVLLDAYKDAARQADQAAWNIGSMLQQDVARNVELLDLSLQAVNDGLQLPEIWSLSPQLRNMVLFHRAMQARYLGFINVLNESGDVIADSLSLTPHGSYANRDYFLAQRRDVHNAMNVGLPFAVRSDPPGSIPISRRLSHPDGTFAGVIVGSIKLAYFRDLFAPLDMGPHGSVTLLRIDGTILMRAPYDLNDIGRTVGPASPFYQFLRTRTPKIEAESTVDHVLRRYSFRQIGDLPLVLSVGFSTDDIFAAWWLKARRILVLVGILCLANITLTVLLRRQALQRAAAEQTARRSEAAQAQRTRELEATNARLASLAEQRAQAVSLAEHAVAAKTRFLATMSHEVRTPLNSILGYTELLAMEGRLDPVQAARLAAMRGAATDLRDVVNDVLDYARGEAQAAAGTAAAGAGAVGTAVGAGAVGTAAAGEPAGAAVGTPTGAAVATAATDLPALIEQCRAQIGPAVAAKGLRLTCDIALDVPRSVALDGAHLRRALINLLGNAVKFTPHGTVALRVSSVVPGVEAAGVQMGGGVAWLRFSVADTGAGIPPDQRSRLFHAYDRLDADRAGIEGTGLGLVIAARLVEGMDGRIGYTDNPGGGAMFWLEIPIGAPAPAVPPQDADNSIAHPAMARGGPTHPLMAGSRSITAGGGPAYSGEGAPYPVAAGEGPSSTTEGSAARQVVDTEPGLGSGQPLRRHDGADGAVYLDALRACAGVPLRVLVVDDSATNRDVAASFLRLAGHAATEAEDGTAAVDLGAAEDFDVVLMDMRMPRMDGVETTRRIRVLPGRRGRVPVVAVTAQVLDDQWPAWQAAGIGTYLAKPYEQAELLTAVVTAASGRDAASSLAAPAGQEGAPAGHKAAPPFAGQVRQMAGDLRRARRHQRRMSDARATGDPAISPALAVAHLDALAADIGTLLALLPKAADDPGTETAASEASDDPGTEALASLAHKLAGDGAMLGFHDLAAAAQRYATAWQQGKHPLLGQLAAALYPAALGTLEAVGQRRALACRAAMSSAKLP